MFHNPRHIRQDNIKLGIEQKGFHNTDWMHLTQDRIWWWALVNNVIKIQNPHKAETFQTSYVTSFFKDVITP
jgi:hypothetical protein